MAALAGGTGGAGSPGTNTVSPHPAPTTGRGGQAAFLRLLTFTSGSDVAALSPEAA